MLNVDAARAVDRVHTIEQQCEEAGFCEAEPRGQNGRRQSWEPRIHDYGHFWLTDFDTSNVVWE